MSSKPEETILSSGLSIEQLHQMARSEPKIALDDSRLVLPPSLGSVVHEEFENNFYKRFLEVRAVLDNQATESQIKYIRMVKERFAVDLITFYEGNSDLCEGICHAARAKNPYDVLVASREEIGVMESMGELGVGSVMELELAADHPIGIEAVGMYYWDRLNPVLEEAYAKISEITLNAPFFSY